MANKLGQKEAVIMQVMVQLPAFEKYVDNAILMLSNIQLEAIKSTVSDLILAGTIEYSKSLTNTSEVRSYARSMVMNHLKKAKELNGGHGYKATPVGGANYVNQQKTIRVKEKIAPKGVNPDLLPEELQEYVKTLV